MVIWIVILFLMLVGCVVYGFKSEKEWNSDLKDIQDKKMVENLLASVSVVLLIVLCILIVSA